MFEQIIKELSSGDPQDVQVKKVLKLQTEMLDIVKQLSALTHDGNRRYMLPESSTDLELNGFTNEIHGASSIGSAVLDSETEANMFGYGVRNRQGQ